MQAAPRAREQYTSGEYLLKNPRWHADESPWKAKYVLQMIARNKLAPKTICDVGCGSGKVLQLVHEGLDRQCRCWGYDISPQAFERSDRLSAERDAGYHVIDYRYTWQRNSLRYVWNENKGNPRRLARRVVGFLARAILALPSRMLSAIHQDLAARIAGQWRLLVLAR